MAPGRKTGGRRVGAPNKRTIEVKRALELAFDELGGVPALVDWGRANPVEFYKLWSKLLPRDFHVTAETNPIGQVVIMLPDNGRGDSVIHPPLLTD